MLLRVTIARMPLQRCTNVHMPQQHLIIVRMPLQRCTNVSHCNTLHYKCACWPQDLEIVGVGQLHVDLLARYARQVHSFWVSVITVL